MLHISKTKNNQFVVTVKSTANNEKLSATETVKSKQSAWKNIRAQMKEFDAESVLVQDNTCEPAQVILYWNNGEMKVLNTKPEKAPVIK